MLAKYELSITSDWDVESYQERADEVEDRYSREMNRYDKYVQEAKEITDWLDGYEYTFKN